MAHRRLKRQREAASAPKFARERYPGTEQLGELARIVEAETGALLLHPGIADARECIEQSFLLFVFDACTGIDDTDRRSDATSVRVLIAFNRNAAGWRVFDRIVGEIHEDLQKSASIGAKRRDDRAYSAIETKAFFLGERPESV